MVRIKERYLLVHIIHPPAAGSLSNRPSVPDVVAHNQPTTDDLTPQALAKGIRSSINDLFGDYGSGAVDRSLQIKYLSNATSTFILRTSRAHYRLVWAALTCMDRLPIKMATPCIFRVVHVSGTIRKIEEEAIRRARRLILQANDDESSGPSADVLNALFTSTGDSDGERNDPHTAAVVADSLDSDDELDAT